MSSEEFMKKNFVCHSTGLVGPHPQDGKMLRFTKRELRCVPDHGWEKEPDPKYAMKVVGQLGLDREDAKTALTPGVHEKRPYLGTEEEDEMDQRCRGRSARTTAARAEWRSS